MSENDRRAASTNGMSPWDLEKIAWERRFHWASLVRLWSKSAMYVALGAAALVFVNR